MCIEQVCMAEAHVPYGVSAVSSLVSHNPVSYPKADNMAQHSLRTSPSLA